jgi:hypothetical protein
MIQFHMTFETLDDLPMFPRCRPRAPGGFAPRRVVLVFLAAAAICAAASDAAPRPDPAALVLRRVDVGRVYTAHGAPVRNADAAQGAPRGFGARLVRWGRRGGYEVDFRRRAAPGTLQDGPLLISSSASLYRDASGAHAAFAYARGHLVPAGYAPLALGFAVGEEASQWVGKGESGLGTILRYVLIWRDRNVDATIVVTGRLGVVSAFDLGPLAHRQEARIRAALR